MSKAGFLALACLALLVSACAAPMQTRPLLDRYAVPQEPRLAVRVIDDREARYREKNIIDQGAFLSPVYTRGDPAFDVPLAKVFEQVMTARYGANGEGLVTECRLKAFYVAMKRHGAKMIPGIGLLALNADDAWSGVLKVDVSVLRPDGKFAFHKTYDSAVSRELPGEATLSAENANRLRMLGEVLTKFLAEFESDMSRVQL